MHFTIGFKIDGKAERITVEADYALISALKAKAEWPEAMIIYVRPQNRRGDARHPSLPLSSATH